MRDYTLNKAAKEPREVYWLYYSQGGGSSTKDHDVDKLLFLSVLMSQFPFYTIEVDNIWWSYSLQECKSARLDSFDWGYFHHRRRLTGPNS